MLPVSPHYYHQQGEFDNFNLGDLYLIHAN